MNHDMIQKSTRTALLLTATLILQGLRLLIPIPPQVSMFVVGALVNACLVVAVLTISWRAGVIVACVTPFFAWLEGMLPLPPFIVPVALGNTVYVLLYYVQQQWRIQTATLVSLPQRCAKQQCYTAPFICSLVLSPFPMLCGI